MPFHGVFNYNDPSEALAFWYDAFLPVVNKHAPLRRKRVKHPKLPPWLTKDIIQAMVLRDKLKRDKLSDLYKKQRNKVSTLVRIAKKNYFNKLTTDNRDTATICRAVNEITRKSRPQSNSSVSNFTPDSFNKHFLSLAEKLTSSKQLTDVRKEYECSSTLKEFCQSKLRNASAFCIPPTAVHEVANLITTLKSKKSMGPNNITPYPVSYTHLTLPTTILV